MRFLGWSFPIRHVREDPMVDCPEVAGELPTVGLLHCDLDASGSLYAPVTLRSLLRPGVDAWLLGLGFFEGLLRDFFHG